MAARLRLGDDVAMTLQQRTPTISGTPRPSRRRGAGQQMTTRRPAAAVGLALDALERHTLSPMDLRILLGVHDGEVSLSELVESFGRGSLPVRMSAGALYARGLLNWRYAPSGEESMLSLTRAGRSIVRSLLGPTVVP